MFEVGEFRTKDCQGTSRRSFLKFGAALPFLPSVTLAGSTEDAPAPKAKSVMLIWLVGGPSHLDLFDPKPNAPAEYRGPFSSISTRTTGMAFTELLPQLATRSDRFSVVRTNINYDGGHRPAGSIAWTCGKATDGGENTNGQPSGYPPNIGSIVSRSRGLGELPGFISLARGPVGDGVGPCLGFGGGVWGTAYDPFMVDCSKQGQVSIPELRLLDGLSVNRLDDRKRILSELDTVKRGLDRTRFEQWDDLNKKAFQLLEGGQTLNAFDVSRELPATRARYGRTSFGQSCLLGRRLV
ncbi:MAG: DUF1501 domain-containing protein, partial [Planctomycetes bacterium]|nr:DUF1501 domain-containing protein [Planctomycetota bacterium]